MFRSARTNFWPKKDKNCLFFGPKSAKIDPKIDFFKKSKKVFRSSRTDRRVHREESLSTDLVCKGEGKERERRGKEGKGGEESGREGIEGDRLIQ